MLLGTTSLTSILINIFIKDILREDEKDYKGELVRYQVAHCGSLKKGFAPPNVVSAR